MTLYNIDELAKAAGITVRKARYYMDRGLLPAAAFHGRSTRYGDEHLDRLRLALRLRAQEGLDLERIRKRLSALDAAQVAAQLAPPPPPPPLPDPQPLPPPLPDPLPPPPPEPEPATAVGQRWDRIPLLPGLELHLRCDATALVRRIAEEIRARFGA